MEQVVHLPAQQQHRLWGLSFRSGQILTTVLGKHVLIRSQKSIMMNHQCPDCDYRTSQSCHLRRHINSIHRKKERLPKCPECKITFSLKEGLQQHIESVHRGKRFQCPECETTFSSFGNHQRHIKSVHRGKKFQCPECDYGASQSTNLHRHINSVHKGERFQCPECEATFSQKGQLPRHIKSIHTDTDRSNNIKSEISESQNKATWESYLMKQIYSLSK